MTEPATLDGGDCMRLCRTIYVGRSGRTNFDGIAQLSRAFPGLRVVPVDLPPTVLHLRCVVSPLGDDRTAATRWSRTATPERTRPSRAPASSCTPSHLRSPQSRRLPHLPIDSALRRRSGDLKS